MDGYQRPIESLSMIEFLFCPSTQPYLPKQLFAGSVKPSDGGMTRYPDIAVKAWIPVEEQ
jgi:hypothetical protein